jgi:hypothetical protein
VKSEYIKTDSLFKDILSHKGELKPLIIDCVEDTTVLDLNICGKKNPLRKGDIAYLLLKELKEAPKECIEETYNRYQGMCMYPIGFLDYLEENRAELLKDLKKCSM